MHKIDLGLRLGEIPLTWIYSNAPPGSGITDATYSVTLDNWRIIDTATSSTLTKEETENVWKITVKNNSSIPLLDNVIVEKNLRENWFVVSNELIFMNPQETYTFRLSKESGVGYFVWTSMAENGITMWQNTGTTQTMIMIIFVAVIGMAAIHYMRRRHRKRVGYHETHR